MIHNTKNQFYSDEHIFSQYWK